jgi:uncharacterized membrane protein
MAIVKYVLLFAMAALYATAGVMHFVSPGFFVEIMPAYLPWHLELVYLSGAIEILLAVLLLVPATRRLAAWGTIALLIAVFPANLNMALNDIRPDGPFGPPTAQALWLRLPMQLVLIAWAWWYTRPDRAASRRLRSA